MPRSSGIKKSNFSAQTVVPSDATFDYVSSGVNYKITYPNLLAGLGVTGSIESDGDPLGVPVLDDQGAVKVIRNIEPGNGLIASVSGLNGVAIASGITQDAVGTPMFADLASDTPAMASLLPGTGMQISKVDDVITFTATGAVASTKKVIVNQLSDFPSPVGDVITLVADTIYVLNDDVDVGANRFTFSNNSGIDGLGTTYSSITTTATGDVFTITGDFSLANFALNAASGDVFACTGGAFESGFLSRFTINTCTSLGTFTNWYSLFWDQGAVVSFTDGLIMTGTCNIFILDLVSFITGYTTAVDITGATFNTCSLNRCGFSYASATNHVKILANSANMNAGTEGRIINCNFDAGATNIVDGFTEADIQWVSEGNLNLPKTDKLGQMYMHIANTTTISGGSGDNGNPIKVDCANDWVSAKADQFTVDTNGRLTYIGINTSQFMVTCNITGTLTSGTQTVSHYIAKNGAIVTATKTQREFSSSAAGSPAPAAGIIELKTNDYVELFVENNTGTNNWRSDILNLYVREV